MTTSDNTGNQAANSLTQKNPRTSNIIIMRLQRHEQRRITHAAVYSLTRHNQGKDWVGLSHDYRKPDQIRESRVTSNERENQESEEWEIISCKNSITFVKQRNSQWMPAWVGWWGMRTQPTCWWKFFKVRRGPCLGDGACEQNPLDSASWAVTQNLNHSCSWCW